MSFVLVILLVSSILAILALVGLIWLIRAVMGEAIKVDDLHDHSHSESGSWASVFLAFPALQSWRKKKPLLLTYRRDSRGRFRRVRR